MSSKKSQTLQKVAAIPPWLFLGFLLISLIATGFALRSNYAQMDELRQAVYAADEQNGDVEGALQELQSYVTNHMNTNLEKSGNVYPPIQLKHTYERLVVSRSEQLAGQNSEIYSQAQQHCEQQIPTGTSGSGRIPCIQQYVQERTPTSTQPAIPDALYKFSFVSPRWSPDLAGWLVVTSVILALATLASFINYFIARKVKK